MIDQLELAVPHVVIDRLRSANTDQIQTSLLSHLGDLVGGVHGVVAADVDEVPNVMSLEHVDTAFEVLLLVCLQLVSTGTDGTSRRRVSQQRDLIDGLGGEVQQFFL